MDESSWDFSWELKLSPESGGTFKKMLYRLEPLRFLEFAAIRSMRARLPFVAYATSGLFIYTQFFFFDDWRSQ